VPTIGVAVAIPEPYGDELRLARLRCGDPLATAIPTHVTLLPPTDVDASAAEAIDDHLTKVAHDTSAFSMLLRGTGTFRPVSPVVFVQVAAGLVECERLAAQVRSGPLAGRELDFPYHPHVTIAHDTPEASLDLAFEELADYEASFDVDGFSLYRHGADGVWRPVRAYTFPAGAPDPGSPTPLRSSGA
jgi:2'-5' RNA ligase